MKKVCRGLITEGEVGLGVGARVAIDTCVYQRIGGDDNTLNSQCRQIAVLVETRQVRVIETWAMVFQAREVVNRRLKRRENKVRSIDVINAGEIVRVNGAPVPDPGNQVFDDKVDRDCVALLVSEQADVVVTVDMALLDYGRENRLMIVSPDEFLSLWLPKEAQAG